MESVEVKIDARAKRVINETSFAYLYVHFCDFIFFRNIYLLFFFPSLLLCFVCSRAGKYRFRMRVELSSLTTTALRPIKSQRTTATAAAAATTTKSHKWNGGKKREQGIRKITPNRIQDTHTTCVCVCIWIVCWSHSPFNHFYCSHPVCVGSLIFLRLYFFQLGFVTMSFSFGHHTLDVVHLLMFGRLFLWWLLQCVRWQHFYDHVN